MQIKCEECCEEQQDMFQDIGSGEDEYGKFTDYECLICFHVTRVYDDEDKNKYDLNDDLFGF